MNSTSIFSRATLFMALGISASLSACGGGEATSSSSSSSGGSGGSGGSGDSSSSSSSSSGDSSSSGGSSAAELKFLATFDSAKGQFPEGLWVTADSKTAYVGYAPTGEIVAVSLADGKAASFGTVPAPPAGKGFITGIIQSAAGDLYVAAASPDPTSGYKPSIYKVPAKGGSVTAPFATHPNMKVPNGLVFDTSGALFVTDSVEGAIFKISPDGKTVTPWLTDTLLKGDASMTNPCKTPLGFPVGANGIALAKDAFYVANTDKALLVKIPIKADGTAGAAVTFSASDAKTCAPLQGADGITLDTDGSVLVAGNGGNALLRVGLDGKAAKLVEGDVFDGPASVSLATLGAKKYAIITNFALTSMTPKPGLLSYGPF